MYSGVSSHKDFFFFLPLNDSFQNIDHSVALERFTGEEKREEEKRKEKSRKEAVGTDYGVMKEPRGSQGRSQTPGTGLRHPSFDHCRI